MKWTVLVAPVVSLFAACGSALVDRDAHQDQAANQNLCFGGKPELAWDGANSTIMTVPSGRRFIATQGLLLWQWGNHIQEVELRTGRWGIVDNNAILKAADRSEAFVWSWGHDPMNAPGNSLVAVNLLDERGHPSRIIVDEQDGAVSTRDSRVVLDGDFIYFTGASLARKPAPRDGFFRVARYGTTLPERVADLPSGDETPFVIAGNDVYWRQDGTLWRRKIDPVGEPQRLTLSKGRKLPLVVGGGRLFFVDENRLLSIPLDGSAPPAEHFKGIDVDRYSATLLVERGCLYWNTAAALMRGKLGQDGLSKPEVIAGKDTFDGSAMDSNGEYLYWIHEASSRVMRLGRSAKYLR
jgi:hypothetical protein